MLSAFTVDRNMQNIVAYCKYCVEKGNIILTTKISTPYQFLHITYKAC